jgi:HPt (histidine-containing phosphotransfer) domain-containing protein
VRIVALTAHAMRHDRDQCLAAGMDDYLSKPFTKDDLRLVLDRWLPAPRPRVPRPEPRVEQADPAENDAPPTLEVATLASLRALEQDGAPDLLSRVMDTYLQSADRLARAVREAVAAGDPAAMARATHTLKSSSAQVGARKLSLLCKELEARGRAGSMEGAQELLAEICQELEAVQEALAVEQLGARDA